MNIFSIFKNKFSRAQVLVIGGPTASGKTGLSIKVAQALKAKGREAEIISADSRQIYKNLEAFSAAATKEEQNGFKHYLVGTEKVSEVKSVQWFQEKAQMLVKEIQERGNTPIIVGCGGFWIQSLLFEQNYPEVPENKALRLELGALDISQLQKKLMGLDPKRYETVDKENPRRLIRSIEIATHLGYVPEINITTNQKLKALFVYLNPEKETNKAYVAKSVASRFAAGLIAELEALRSKLTEKQFIELGSTAKFIHEYWGGNLDLEGLSEKTVAEEIYHSKKQKTFFNKLFKNYTGMKTQIDVGEEKEIREIISKLKI